MNALCAPSFRPRVAIVDPCCAAGYDTPDLETGGLGGTEATVLRVTAALSPQFNVTHFQNARWVPDVSGAGRLMPLQAAINPGAADVFIVINRWKVALRLRKANPKAPIFLWLHVYPGRHNRKMGAALQAAGITVICVSRSHACRLAAFMCDARPDITFIHNPVAPGLAPDTTPRDPNRLLFASSPHKGLRQVFAQFAALRAEMPDLRLAVADPGYLRWDTGPVPDGVMFLGALSHADLIAQMRQAVCLFYPQTHFAETFGLFMAEANAVGTPALVHRGLGANYEVLHGTDQSVDGKDAAAIANRVRAWRAAPPRITGNPAFHMPVVVQAWTDLLQRASARQPEKVG
jgi:glycosyltransferase involved in cell wall biosynthesis